MMTPINEHIIHANKVADMREMVGSFSGIPVKGLGRQEEKKKVGEYDISSL